ncbi:MAG TPA: hypothetical protein VJ652_15400, partial [Noviherbaspirillum sp.]|nr:hypothetical protein [Noviherbaspirillum sp.]
RILLASDEEEEAAIDAIKRGEIFRFFTRPWNDKTLRDIIRDAFHHHSLLRDARAGRMRARA